MLAQFIYFAVACIEIKHILTKVSVIRDFLKYHKSWNILIFRVNSPIQCLRGMLKTTKDDFDHQQNTEHLGQQ